MQTTKDIIQNSNLTESEKSELTAIVDSFDEKTENELNNLLNIHPALVYYLYVNYAAKKYALAKNDLQSYEKFVKASERVLDLLDE